MDRLEERVGRAKYDTRELDRMTRDYLPFIKKQLQGLGSLALEYDDMISLAMLTFIGCVQQYETSRGGFLSFCQACIRNRLIDEARRHRRYTSKVVPLYADDMAESARDDEISCAAYNREQEKQALREEIEQLSAALLPFGISFGELARICPKQAKSRQRCCAVARAVAAQEGWRNMLLEQHRLPQAALAEAFGLSPKTIEKHRKYIVTLVILLAGDYPRICSFLPQYEEVK